MVLLVGCGGGVIQRADKLPQAPPGQGFLEVLVAPKDADIYLGDAYAGRVDGYAQGVLRLPAGTHRVTLSKPGFYSHYAVVEVGQDGARIAVELVPRPEGPPATRPVLPNAPRI